MKQEDKYFLYIFSLIVAIFEVNLYAGNDMIMPGMLKVVYDFHASASYVPSSLSFFLLGFCALQLFIGPIANYLGNKATLILGSVLFVLFSFFISISNNITVFMLGRFLHGACLGFIPIAYSVLYVYFDEVTAIRVVAVMANLTVLAPILAPLLGALIVSVSSWRSVFYVNMIVGIIPILGFLFFTPTSKDVVQKVNSVKLYLILLSKLEFIYAAVFGGFSLSVIIIWIALSPVIMMQTLHLSLLKYVMYQAIIFSGIFMSTVALHILSAKFTSRLILQLSLLLSFIPCLVIILAPANLYFYVAALTLFVLLNSITVNIIQSIISKIINNENITLILFLFIKSMLASLIVELVGFYIAKLHFSFISFSYTTLIMMISSMIMSFLFYQQNKKNNLLSFT